MMNEDCNVAIRNDGIFMKCQLGKNHFGKHDYQDKEPEKSLSTSSALIILAVTTPILILVYFEITNQWIQPRIWYNLALWGILIVTFFSGIFWLVSLGQVLKNLYDDHQFKKAKK